MLFPSFLSTASSHLPTSSIRLAPRSSTTRPSILFLVLTPPHELPSLNATTACAGLFDTATTKSPTTSIYLVPATRFLTNEDGFRIEYTVVPPGSEAGKRTEMSPWTKISIDRPQNFWFGATCPYSCHCGGSEGDPEAEEIDSQWNARTGGWCETFSDTKRNPVEANEGRGQRKGVDR